MRRPRGMASACARPARCRCPWSSSTAIQELQLGNAFCAAALRHGIYLHPRHNMFLCAAHQPADIDRAIEAADAAMADIVATGHRPD